MRNVNTASDGVRITRPPSTDYKSVMTDYCIFKTLQNDLNGTIPSTYDKSVGKD